jgi:hypothetical protein
MQQNQIKLNNRLNSAIAAPYLAVPQSIPKTLFPQATTPNRKSSPALVNTETSAQKHIPTTFSATLTSKRAIKRKLLK